VIEREIEEPAVPHAKIEPFCGRGCVAEEVRERDDGDFWEGCGAGSEEKRRGKRQRGTIRFADAGRNRKGVDIGMRTEALKMGFDLRSGEAQRKGADRRSDAPCGKNKSRYFSIRPVVKGYPISRTDSRCFQNMRRSLGHSVEFLEGRQAESGLQGSEPSGISQRAHNRPLA